MKKMLFKLVSDRRGATAIEYAVIASLIAVAIIGSVTLVGTKTANLFSNVSSQVSAAG